MTVLVTAASRHGATREIAGAIGRALAERGIETDVREIEEAGDPASYEAVVLGSAVYMGQWLGPARRFVEEHAEELAARPVWLFSSGPLGEPLRPEEDEAVEVDEILAATAAREHRLFAGRLDRGGLSLPERAVVRAVRAVEGDFRDWDEVAEWAAGIASEVGAGAPR